MSIHSVPWPPGAGEMAARIRAHHWASTPLGPVEAWSERLKGAVEQVLASPLVSSLVCGPERLLIYNDAAARLYGDRHPRALGRPLPEVFPEGWQAVGAALYERVFAGETVQVAAQPLDVRGEPGRAPDVFDAVLTPVRDAGGRVVAAHMVGFEVGGRLRAEAALRESEERQGFLLGLSDALRPLADAVAIQGVAARLLGERLGAGRAYYFEYEDEGAHGAVLRDYVADGSPSLVGHYAYDTYRTVYDRVRDGRTWVVPDVGGAHEIAAGERELLATLGVVAWIDVPLVKQGTLVAVLCVTQNRPRAWTDAEVALVEATAERTWAAVERARAEAYLRASEDRYRTLFETMGQGYFHNEIIRGADGRAVDFRYLEHNPAFERLLRVRPGEGRGRTAIELFGAVEQAWLTAAEEAVRSGEPQTIEHQVATLGRWYEARFHPAGDDRFTGLFDDVTERKRADAALRESEERLQVLVAELQHRTRNLIAVVRSLSDKTLARSASLADFRTRFGDRLAALARVQGLLSRLAEGERVTFGELIRSELSALGGDAERISLEGPEGVALRSSTVQTLALALHELATNAAKYGALAQTGGRLAISWRLEHAEADGRPWLHVDWRESGVTLAPEGAAAQGGGSGRELIERALPYQLKARTAFVLAEDGVHCTIALPVSERSRVASATQA